MKDAMLNNENTANKGHDPNIKDVQSIKDNRHVYINKVGIKNVRYPVIIKNGDSDPQNTIARINLFVYLPEDRKGTHMSRFLEIINEHNQIDISHPEYILREVKERLNTSGAYIDLRFPFFLEKEAPVTKRKSMMDYYISFKSSLNKNDELHTIFEIEVPVTTLCPCSKEISDFGAHSQRGIVNLSLITTEIIDIKKMIKLVEESASCDLYPILKREDEKYVTEKAYSKPVFVEDLVRNISLKMEEVENILYYKCEVENYESIHKHNAYACIERDYR